MPGVHWIECAEALRGAIATELGVVVERRYTAISIVRMWFTASTWWLGPVVNWRANEASTYSNYRLMSVTNGRYPIQHPATGPAEQRRLDRCRMRQGASDQGPVCGRG